MKKILLVFFVFNLIFISKIFPHGDIHDRIVKVTEEIKKSPDSAYLYLKRGKLYYQHEAYKSSIDDLHKSETLGYNTIEQKLLFAKGYYKLKVYEKAISFCEDILSHNPKNVRALKVKAQTYFKQERFYKSAIAYEEVIHYSNQSFPENYIDASHAWELLDKKEGSNNAITIIKKGIENLGNLISLYDRLLEIYINQNDYTSAISTQLMVIKLSPRKETAYYKLSELYILNNDNKNASVSLNLAKEHFGNLPIRLQSTSFMKELKKKIKEKETTLHINKS